MDIRTNFQSTRPAGYLQGLEEANKTGDTAKLGGLQNVTAGMEVSVLNQVNDIRTKLGIPTLSFGKMMSAEEVEENIKSLDAKLNSTAASFRGKPVMFDIYALMDIIQEMSQKMRNAMRELRTMENQVIQTNIKAQASAQRTAAISSMIAGAAMCLVQAAVAAATTKSSISSMSKQSEMLKQSGLEVMSEQNNLANNVGNPDLCESALGDLAQAYPDVAKEINLQMEEPRANACNAEQKAIEDIKAEVAANPPKTPEESVAANQKIADAFDKYQGARAAEGDRVLTKNADVVDRAVAEFKSIRQAANEELATKGEISPEMQGKLDSAKGKLLYARAKQVSIATKMMISVDKSDAFIDNPSKVQQSIQQDAGSLFKLTEEGAISKADAINFSKLQAKLTLVTGLNQAIGQLGQNVVSGVKELKMAGVTELQAKQKMLEEDLDQIKDLFSQSLAVMQKVFQLFEAITQKESSTLENIIMA